MTKNSFNIKALIQSGQFFYDFGEKYVCILESDILITNYVWMVPLFTDLIVEPTFAPVTSIEELLQKKLLVPISNEICNLLYS